MVKGNRLISGDQYSTKDETEAEENKSIKYQRTRKQVSEGRKKASQYLPRNFHNIFEQVMRPMNKAGLFKFKNGGSKYSHQINSSKEKKGRQQSF